MKQQGWGRIINTTSRGRFGTDIDNCNYAAAKAGIVGLAKNVATDLGSYGITCNVYGPGAATRLNKAEESLARFDRMIKMGIPVDKKFVEQLKNLPPPETIPPFLIYLCTDEAANINGLVFDIFGQEIRIYTEEMRNHIVKEKGLWTIEELRDLVPKVLLKGIKGTYKNPS
jgi:NAD(P)-dependent dehydrogenase (short-subunit alcohol dehydrogenase family)